MTTQASPPPGVAQAVTFAEIKRKVPLKGWELWQLFDGLPAEMQAAAWRDVRQRAENEERRR